MGADLLHWIGNYGPAALGVLLMLGVFGLPVPDETLLTFAGVLVRHGRMYFATTWLAAACGSMGGITLSYIVGRRFGPAAVTRFGRWLHVSQADLVRVEKWLERSGKWSLTFGYFVPGVRHFTAIVAGSSQLPVRIFAVYAYSGAVLWSLVFIVLGWMVGNQWERALETAHRHLATVAVLAVAGAGVYALIHRRVWAREERREKKREEGREGSRPR
jgi:membrane protein DedA with SNARE-associated domain